MNKTISPKITALTFGILATVFLAAFYVIAWQEPTEAPPGGNVATPLNVSITGQAKEGGLILNTGGAENALIIDKGKICIGSDCRSAWPETGLLVTYKMAASSYQVGDKYYSKTVSYNCSGPEGTGVTIINCPQPDPDAILCKCSGSGPTATLTAYVLQTKESSTGETTSYRAVDYCQRSVYPYIKCTVVGCNMEFQCAITKQVGQ